jgi:uncharacterized protein YeaO (DUF488 family)
MISTFRIGTPRRRSEGLRIGTVRFLPRGVKKQDYARLNYFDVWLPLLAPNKQLVAWARSRGIEKGIKPFFARYRNEVLKDTDAKQTLIMLAMLGKEMNLSVGCYCPDESRCHRSELLRLLKQAAAGKL